MKIANLGYSPINNSNINYQNKQQNPAFKGAIIAQLEDITKYPQIRILLQELSQDMSWYEKKHGISRLTSVGEPFVKAEGSKREGFLLFGKGLNSFAKKWVDRYENGPLSEKVAGLSFKFDPTQSSDSIPDAIPVRQHPIVRLLHWAFS